MRISSGFIALATLFGCLTVASADDTGLASIHEWRHAGSKTCFVDHTHDGSGTGATKSAALAEAIRNWQDFTVLEYGTDWGYYRTINVIYFIIISRSKIDQIIMVFVFDKVIQ